jgi:hypothetical protein
LDAGAVQRKDAEPLAEEGFFAQIRRSE